MRRSVFAAPTHRGAAVLHGGMGVLTPLISLVRRLSGHLPFDPRIKNLENHLLSCGLSQPPLDDLSVLAQSAGSRDTRTSAAIVLARWHMRPQGGADPAAALNWVKAAQGTARAPAQRRYLAILEVLCLHALGARDKAQHVFRSALDAGHDSPDLMLAAANLETGDTARIGWINRALGAYGIPPIGLNDEALPRFDRLICADRLPIRTEGPTVSVILAAHAAEVTLPTALRSLQDQTWQNLEILVVDDASPTDGTARITREFAAQDPRIRLIEMAENGGAYMARNRALELATGEYVTLHDADDWSHPRRIEVQVDFLRGAKAVLACTSEQARATDDLGFERWIGAGSAIVTNYASLMFRREVMREHFGYWDTVRLSADNELIRRMRAAFGARAVRFLPTGPLAFQRYAPRSMTSDPVLGISGVLYGARQEYYEAQMHAHRAAPDLRYGNDPATRPFPAPGLMRPDRAWIAAQENAFDVIVATDFRSPDTPAQDALEDIGAARKKGLRVAVFALYRYSGVSRRIQPVAMAPEVRQRLWDLDIRILCYGEEALCRSLLIHDPATIAHPQRFLPRIASRSVALIARVGSSGLQTAMATAQDSFDAPARCHPFDRAARLSLQAQGDLAAQDWDTLRYTLGISA